MSSVSIAVSGKARVTTVLLAGLLIAAMLLVVGCNGNNSSGSSSSPSKPAGLQSSDVEGYWVNFGSVEFDRSNPDATVKETSGVFMS